jgi:ParB family chromosome partitioning protein
LRLPTEILDFLRDGSLTAGQARPLVPLPIERALSLAQLAVAEGLSARRIEALAKGRGGARKVVAQVDPDTSRAAERLTRRLHAKVEIRRRGKAGRVILHFHDEEELMRLFDLLNQAGE